MAIVAFTGHFGSGKSALASYWAARYIVNGWPVWANYSLCGARPIRTVDELYDCLDGLILIDEMQGTAHARTFTRDSQMGFLKWFDQCRKTGSDLWLITQALYKVDKIIRGEVDYEVNCVNRGEIPGGPALTDVTVWDLRSHIARRVSAFAFDRRAAYGLYDHRERAWPLVAAAAQRPAAGAAARKGSAAVSRMEGVY